MTENRADFFLARAKTFVEQEKEAAKKSSWVSWLRVAVFLAGVALAYHFFSTDNEEAAALAIGVFYILFVVVLRWHNRLDFVHKQFKLVRELNEQEAFRLQGKLSEFDGGVEFKDDQHPYTSDLDIFGNNSLFQLVNRSVTSLGKVKLASWMRKAASPAQVMERQKAVKELAHEQGVNWLQDLIALPRHYNHNTETAAEFIDWFKDKAFYKEHPVLKLLIFVLPILTLAAIAFWSYGGSGYIPLIFLAIQSVLAYKHRVARDEYYDKSMGIFEALRSYTKQLRLIEDKQFTAPMLVDIQNWLTQSGTKASVIIHKLANIIDFFSWRLSTLMAFFLNTILMWDFLWMYRLEKWRDNYLSQLHSILDALAEMEALTSVAAYTHANPAYTFPMLSQEPFKVKAEALAHPLIFSVNPVSNNFEIEGAGKTVVITGSNMSGKTTFLRTIGINMVLGLMGAPVFAKSFALAPAQVYTAMRTADNLAENTSSFYAELKRLRMLLGLTEQGQPVFYLLDEILKGTNSKDRHAGAMALIRQLHKRNASGLISTHDLELGAMEQELPGSVFNYSFNSDIIGDEIKFDYKLQKGICRSFNASKLMQLMGIEIEEKV